MLNHLICQQPQISVKRWDTLRKFHISKRQKSLSELYSGRVHEPTSSIDGHVSLLSSFWLDPRASQPTELPAPFLQGVMRNGSHTHFFHQNPGSWEKQCASFIPAVLVLSSVWVQEVFGRCMNKWMNEYRNKLSTSSNPATGWLTDKRFCAKFHCFIMTCNNFLSKWASKCFLTLGI